MTHVQQISIQFNNSKQSSESLQSLQAGFNGVLFLLVFQEKRCHGLKI